MPQDEAAQKQVMESWTKWFDDLGPRVVNMGAPFGQSKAVNSDGTVGGGTSGLTGFSIVKADSLDAAAELAKSCPVLTTGASVEVYETVAM